MLQSSAHEAGANAATVMASVALIPQGTATGTGGTTTAYGGQSGNGGGGGGGVNNGPSGIAAAGLPFSGFMQVQDEQLAALAAKQQDLRRQQETFQAEEEGVYCWPLKTLFALNYCLPSTAVCP